MIIRRSSQVLGQTDLIVAELVDGVSISTIHVTGRTCGDGPLEARSHTTGVIGDTIAKKINTADFAMECATDMPDLEQKSWNWDRSRYAHSHPTAALSSLTIVFSCSSYHACSHSGRFKSGRKNPEAKT